MTKNDVKPLALAELPEALALCKNVFMKTTSPHFSKEGTNTFLRFINEEDMKRMSASSLLDFFGCRDREGALCGVGARRIGGHISLLFLDPSKQRSGIGAALVERMAQGVTSPLTVHAAPNAVGFYKKLGFAATDIEQCSDGIQFVPMERPSLKSGETLTQKILTSPLTEEDMPFVKELEAQCFSDPWSLKSLRDTLREERTILLGAKTNKNSLVGYLSASFILDECNLNRICVGAPFRRLGVADALLDAFVLLCREKEIRHIYLEVREGNKPAQALYQKHGFHSLGTRPRFYTDPEESALLMGFDFL